MKSSRKHLRRLPFVFLSKEEYFLTIVTRNRQKVLACAEFHEIALYEFKELKKKYGWVVERYVIMPDHVHMLCAPTNPEAHSLEVAIGKWKEWTSKKAIQCGLVENGLWQKEFFDHLLRSSESAEQKWSYVRLNPVRAGLVKKADDWPYQGGQ